VDEFALIGEVVAQLGDRARGGWVAHGPGDDAAVIAQTPDCQAVASIDTLVAGVHFPVDMPAEAIGYRALMVSLSDLAAMAATPRYALVALTLPVADPLWVRGLAQGMAAAARRTDVYICGGNFAQGPLSLTVSVHGEVENHGAVMRSGAEIGDRICVSGPLGGAAACVRLKAFDVGQRPSPMQQCYHYPRARFDLLDVIRRSAHAAIDISDGLSKDLEHLCRASGVGADLHSANIPLVRGATLEDALYGGDDYEILCTAAAAPAELIEIGVVTAGPDVTLDGLPISARGYNHFEP
jgi:thiamine-monophosphate kinase